MNFAKFLKTLFPTEHLRCLLLPIIPKINYDCLTSYQCGYVRSDTFENSSTQFLSKYHHYNKNIVSNHLEVFCKKLSACNFTKKDTPTQVFSSEFCAVFKNNFSTEHLRWLLLNHMRMILNLSVN